MPFLILSNWVNPKYAYSKMKINEHLLSCCTLFSTRMAKAFPFNEEAIKVALSLQGFHFPQILLTFSERTHKTAALCKWKSILLLKAKARTISVARLLPRQKLWHIRPRERSVWEVGVCDNVRQSRWGWREHRAAEATPGQGRASSVSQGEPGRLPLTWVAWMWGIKDPNARTSVHLLLYSNVLRFYLYQGCSTELVDGIYKYTIF